MTKLFADQPRVLRIKRIGLLIGLFWLLAFIFVIFWFLPNAQQTTAPETIESDLENTAWLQASPKVKPPEQPITSPENHLALDQSQKERLAAALAELDKEKMAAQHEDSETRQSPYDSAIRVSLESNESEEKTQSPTIATLPAGTILSTVLLPELTSDLPGETLAQVLWSVYDASGQHIIIPQGAKLILSYNGASLNQNRIQLSVHRIVFPSGITQSAQGMVSLDLQGNVGLHDKINHHYVNNFLSLLIPDLAGTVQLAGETGRLNAGTFASQLTTYHSPPLRPPTVHLRRGYRFNLLVTDDIAIKSD
jgi:type IV secretory pathway VirB10-like protein